MPANDNHDPGPNMVEFKTQTPSGKDVPLMAYVGGDYVRFILMNEGTFAFKLTFDEWAKLCNHIEANLTIRS